MPQKLTRTVEYTEMAKNQMSEMITITSKTIEQQIRHCIKKKKIKIREHRVKDSCLQKETHVKIEYF